MIRVDALTRRYGSFVALDGVSFCVGKGEVLGFLGPNGAGKTTTMKILTGFLAPSAGEARIGGLTVDGRDGEFRDLVGYLPENAPAYGEMRIVDYLNFVARVRGMSRGARRAGVEQALDRCGLREMARREIRALSKGYRQRVGLAQSIVHDPPVLILDEPTSGLDPNQVVEIRRLIRELGRARTIMFSSHVMREVRAVADRVIILDRGRIVADGSPDALSGTDEGRARVRVGGGSEAEVLAVLGALSEVTSATVDDDAIRVVGPDGDVMRAAVARAVVEAGWSLHELVAERADLEAVFRRVTDRGVDR